MAELSSRGRKRRAEVAQFLLHRLSGRSLDDLRQTSEASIPQTLGSSGRGWLLAPCWRWAVGPVSARPTWPARRFCRSRSTVWGQRFGASRRRGRRADHTRVGRDAAVRPTIGVVTIVSR